MDVWVKRAVAILLVLTVSGGLATDANANAITFEFSPDGSTPVDNQPLAVTGTYQDGTTFVGFGIDSNDDLEVDHPALFELRTNDDRSTGQVGYILNEGSHTPWAPDVDNTLNNEGGEWLIRSQRGNGGEQNLGLVNGNDFMIVYSGVLPTSASGQIWDLDYNEIFSVTAFSEADVQISEVLTGPYADHGRDGLPTTFSFDSLSTPIAKIRISFVSSDAGGGFAFDNFNATQPAPVVPEPGTGFLLLSGLVGLGMRRRVSQSRVGRLSGDAPQSGPRLSCT